MLKQKHGKIVSISSIYGFTGNATRSSYAAAKAGVAVYQILALEVAKDGISVNAIAPGRVSTPRCAATIQTSNGRKRWRKFPRAVQEPRTRPPALPFFSFPTRIATLPVRHSCERRLAQLLSEACQRKSYSVTKFSRPVKSNSCEACAIDEQRLRFVR